MTKKGEIGKPETWPKKVKADYCLCGSTSWHKACYSAVPVIKDSPRSILSHGGL